jgi:hypothetical protein
MGLEGYLEWFRGQGEEEEEEDEEEQEQERVQICSSSTFQGIVAAQVAAAGTAGVAEDIADAGAGQRMPRKDRMHPHHQLR